jgi:hypothetical protein
MRWYQRVLQRVVQFTLLSTSLKLNVFYISSMTTTSIFLRVLFFTRPTQQICNADKFFFHEQTKHIKLDCLVFQDKIQTGMLHFFPRISSRYQVIDILQNHFIIVISIILNLSDRNGGHITTS